MMHLSHACTLVLMVHFDLERELRSPQLTEVRRSPVGLSWSINTPRLGVWNRIGNGHHSRHTQTHAHTLPVSPLLWTVTQLFTGLESHITGDWKCLIRWGFDKVVQHIYIGYIVDTSLCVGYYKGVIVTSCGSCANLHIYSLLPIL